MKTTVYNEQRKLEVEVKKEKKKLTRQIKKKENKKQLTFISIKRNEAMEKREHVQLFLE